MAYISSNILIDPASKMTKIYIQQYIDPASKVTNNIYLVGFVLKISKKNIENDIRYKQNHKTIALRKNWIANEKDETSLKL